MNPMELEVYEEAFYRWAGILDRAAKADGAALPREWVDEAGAMFGRVAVMRCRGIE